MEQREVWNAIAEKWNNFRAKPVEEVIGFLKDKSGKILDLGCGSGRNFIDSKDLQLYGIDFSKELLEFAKKKNYVELKEATTDKIPYDDNFFDATVFVRVLHCVNSEEKRIKTLEEIYRTLKPNSEAIISTWSKNHPRLKNKDKTCFMPWTVDGETYERYTYLYDKDELEKQLKDVGFEIISIKEDKNIIALVKKSISS